MTEIPPEIEAKFREHLQREEERVQRYGHVQPIIHVDHQGHKFVAVGDKPYYSKKWKTFHDFLFDYVKDVLGPDWGSRELKKLLAERHPIMQWYHGLCKLQQQPIDLKEVNGIYSGILNGVAAAYLNLAYDLYLLRDNLALQKRVLDRLKNPDQFQGARYELFVAATCIRAGFEIQYEDETDVRKKHPEFIAVHKETGQKICVEAKSKGRRGVLGFPGVRQPDKEVETHVRRLLNDALRKTPSLPYVIFIDLNYPPFPGDVREKPWFMDVLDSLPKLDDKERDRFNLILFTNHPHHYGREDEADPEKNVIVCESRNPLIRAQHPNVLRSLFYAALKYGNVPHEFPET